MGLEQIKNVTVIGAGNMGKGVARLALLAGYEKVTLNDISNDALEKAAKDIENNMKYLEREEQFEQFISSEEFLKLAFATRNLEDLVNDVQSVGKIAEGETVESLIKKLVLEEDLQEAVRDADFILEMVPEILTLKREIFKKLGEYTPEHTILASNTSTLKLSEIVEHSGKLEKVVAMHFHGTPGFAQLIEVAKGEYTSNETFDTAVELANRLPNLTGPRYIAKLDKQTPALIANRLLLAPFIYLNWLIDQAAEKELPWERLEADIGPICEFSDYGGLDLLYYVLISLERSISPDYTPGVALTKLFEQGNYGLKTGKGFYDWDENGKPIINESLRTQKAGIVETETLNELTQAIRFNEACRLLEEGVVKSYKYLDEVHTTGNGPPKLFPMGKKRYQKWSQMLEDLAVKINKPYLKPCEIMKSGRFKEMR